MNKSLGLKLSIVKRIDKNVNKSINAGTVIAEKVIISVSLPTILKYNTVYRTHDG